MATASEPRFAPVAPVARTRPARWWVPDGRGTDHGQEGAGGGAALGALPLRPRGGVALDLELGGVTGFVRFKNSWGQGWGEHGLCLLSVADLELLLVDGEALFAVPADGPEAAPEDPGPKLLAASEAEPGPPPELFV